MIVSARELKEEENKQKKNNVKIRSSTIKNGDKTE
jgi:hypothetical protein